MKGALPIAEVRGPAWRVLMSQHDDGLSDVLREMAAGQQPAPPSHPQPMPEIQAAERIDPKPRPQPRNAGVSPRPQPVTRASTSRPAARAPSQTRRAPSTNTRTAHRRPAARSSSHGLKATAAPLLATVGVLLLVPALWSVLTLSGMNVVGSDREDAQAMAMVMLVCWPVALCLLIAAGVFLKQILQENKRRSAAQPSRTTRRYATPGAMGKTR